MLIPLYATFASPKLQFGLLNKMATNGQSEFSSQYMPV